MESKHTEAAPTLRAEDGGSTLYFRLRFTNNPKRICKWTFTRHGVGLQPHLLNSAKNRFENYRLVAQFCLSWRASEVAQWVRSLNPTFGPEAMIFDDEGIDGEMLLTLDDDIMKNELKVESTLHRKKILSNIQKRKAEWEMKFGEPEPAPVPAPTPPPAEKKSKKDPSKKEKKSKKSSKSSKSSSKKSSKSSKVPQNISP